MEAPSDDIRAFRLELSETSDNRAATDSALAKLVSAVWASERSLCTSACALSREQDFDPGLIRRSHCHCLFICSQASTWHPKLLSYRLGEAFELVRQVLDHIWSCATLRRDHCSEVDLETLRMILSRIVGLKDPRSIARLRGCWSEEVPRLLFMGWS